MIGLILLAAGNSKRFISSLATYLENNQIEFIEKIDKNIQKLVPLLKSGLKINKIFLEIKNKMVWQYSVEVFNEFKDKITNIVFVLNPTTFEFHRKIIEEKMGNYNFKNIEFVEGGEKRQDSVFNGIKKLEDKYIDYIIVHDLARPLIKKEDVYKLIEKIEDYDGLSLYTCPDDSVASYYEQVTYLPRNKIYLIKTPQIFKKEALLNAHEELRKEDLQTEFTDDISLLDFYLFKVGFIEGDKYNLKITTFEDYLAISKLI